MPNMLTNAVAIFRKPSGTPKTYTDDVSFDCAFLPASAAQKNWAKFAGVLYEFKVCAVLSDAKQAEITEEWRVKIAGVEYSIQEIQHKQHSNGYDHTTMMVAKI